MRSHSNPMQLTHTTHTAIGAATLPQAPAVPRAHGYEVRSATAADTSEILSLIAATYQDEQKLTRADYWHWKHHLNPFGVSPCLVAESNGRLIGVRVFLRWNWRAGAQDVRAVRAVDTATHPDWRGRGIFSRLTMRLVEQMQREGVSFIFNTPNGNSMPGYIKMGWTAVTRIPLWIRPLGLTWAGRALRGVAPEPTIISGDGSLARVLDDRNLASFLVNVTPSDHRLHTARTAAYLRWRYGTIPGESYCARFETDGDAGALIIARGRLRGRLRALLISELLVTPSTRGMQIGRALLSDLARHVDADYMAACTATGTAEQRILARSGFIPVPRLGPHFTARRLHHDGIDPTEWRNWRCSIGDLELF